ncbi:O-antigen ligase family protein [bacterium]|nr:O-antigen ligase family protein [bacterium]
MKIAVGVFFLLALTGEFYAFEPAQFRFKLVHLIRALLVFYVFATRLSTLQEVKFTVIGLLFGLGFQAFIGFWQWQIGPLRIPFFNIDQSWRVSGTIGVANAFGLYLITLIPLCIRMALYSRLKSRVLWFIVSGLAIGSLLATFTRGAWIGLLVSLAIFAFYDFKSHRLTKKQLSLLFFVGFSTITFFYVKYGHIITGRMEDAEEALYSEKKHSRVGLAQDAIRIIRLHPLLGVGLDNYRYHADPEIAGLQIVHNTYLLIAAEQGVFCALLFLMIYLSVLVKGLLLLKSPDPFIYHIGSATLAGLTGALIYDMVAPDYRLAELLIQHWRLLGMIIGLLIVSDFNLRRRALLLKQRKAAKERITPRSSWIRPA